MKITVIKKATTAKPTGYCAAFVDDGLAEQEVDCRRRHDGADIATLANASALACCAGLLLSRSWRPGADSHRASSQRIAAGHSDDWRRSAGGCQRHRGCCGN